MMQTAELATQLPTHGRPIKFTPERVQQIRNLVERGKSREEIAELIGGDRWFAASHLFKVRDQSAASCF
jgi:DNA-binding NarL/FixJ family response regulator